MTHTDIDRGALPNVQFRQVGKPLTRTDAPGKVAGRTPYAGDYMMPNMLHMRVLRADIASARLVPVSTWRRHGRSRASPACSPPPTCPTARQPPTFPARPARSGWIPTSRSWSRSGCATTVSRWR